MFTYFSHGSLDQLMKKFISLLLLLIIMAVFMPLTTQITAAETTEKKILVLYKKRDPDHRGIVLIFTEFLKQAGYNFDMQDVEEILTELPDMSSYTGVLTCFQTSQMIDGDKYPFWLVEQMEAGRRILIIGNYGAYQGLRLKPDGSLIEWNESTTTINTFFYPFGLEFYFAFTGDNNKLRLGNVDRKYAQYQTEINQNDLNYYQLFKSVNPANKILFEVERTDIIDSKSAFNVITPFGAMILEGYSYFWDPVKQKNIFRVNFPELFKEVFSSESPSVPRLNYSTHSDLLEKNPVPARNSPVTLPNEGPKELQRKILVLYKKSETESITELPFFNRAGIVLEYLGLIPVYRAVEDGLPDESYMASIRGIATWHTTQYMYGAELYGKWFIQQIQNGKKIAILQEYGALYDAETLEPVISASEVMKTLGIRFDLQSETRQKATPKVEHIDSEMVGFEHELEPAMITYDHAYTSFSDSNKVFLSLNDPYSGNVDLGIITPFGGVCLKDTPFYFPERDSDRLGLIKKALEGEISPEGANQPTLGAWIINPFKFFKDSFDLDALPAPDITTLNGSRIFYAHIDGDGFESVSQIDGTHSAGFYIFEKILKKYKWLPTSVSVITKQVEQAGNQYYNPAVTLARDIFSLPNVEVAVHAATHPFDWVKGDPYITNPDEYPYKIGYKKPDIIEEIWGAALFADHNLASSNKKTKAIFWTGATNPGPKALEIAWHAGLNNLNGGDPRFDDKYPSLAGLAPYSLPSLPYRQYYTSAQNDYFYSLFLKGDWGGQKKLLDHFSRTDKPRRVYPMNLYYHFYGGIKHESLNALYYIYDYIRNADVAAIFASQYCKIVEDYYKTQISITQNRYKVENSGFLRTIRFNRKVHVDVERSKGVVGYSFYNGQTYVYLDGTDIRTIQLSEEQPNTPYIVQATQFIDHSSYENSQLTFTVRGFGNNLIKVGGLKPETVYHLTLSTLESFSVTISATANQEGIASFATILSPPIATYNGSISE